jgi:hypothetical protein
MRFAPLRLASSLRSLVSTRLTALAVGVAALAAGAAGCVVRHPVDHMHVEMFDELGGFTSLDCPVARVTYEQGTRRGELPADYGCTFTDLYARPFMNDDVYADSPVTFHVETYASSPYRSFSFVAEAPPHDDAIYAAVRLPHR